MTDFNLLKEHYISIHGLRVEPDVKKIVIANAPFLFQSTGSAWSPTRNKEGYYGYSFISIHGLRVEPDSFWSAFKEIYDISIHGLRVEPDMQAQSGMIKTYLFQSTGSAWSPTDKGDVGKTGNGIFQSTGSAWSPTSFCLQFTATRVHFNPRAPRGARQQTCTNIASRFMQVCTIYFCSCAILCRITPITVLQEHKIQLIRGANLRAFHVRFTFAPSSTR